MPIYGLTKDVGIKLGLPLIARIHKGSEKQQKTNADGKTYETVGRDLDYFRVVFEPQFADLLEVFDSIYTEQPTEFENVLLAAGTVDDAFDTWMEEWTTTTMLHKCDGKQQHRWYNASIQEYSNAHIACVHKTDTPCKCNRIGRLNIILPDFTDATGALGYFQITTHSIQDIITVYQYLARIESTCGSLKGVPFTFGRAGKEISAPKQVKKNGKLVKDGRIKVTKSLFYIHADPEYVQDVVLPLLKAAPALPQLEAPKVRIDSGKAMKMLGQGDKLTRRIGATVDLTGKDGVTETIEGEIVPDTVEQSTETTPESVATPTEAITTAEKVENAANSPSDAKEEQSPNPFKKEFGLDWDTDFQNLMKHAGLASIKPWEKRGAVIRTVKEQGLLDEVKSISEAVKVIIGQPEPA